MSYHSLKVAKVNEILTNLYHSLHKTEHDGLINCLLFTVIGTSALSLKVTLDTFAKHILKRLAISYGSISTSENKQLVIMIVAEYIIYSIIQRVKILQLTFVKDQFTRGIDIF